MMDIESVTSPRQYPEDWGGARTARLLSPRTALSNGFDALGLPGLLFYSAARVAEEAKAEDGGAALWRLRLTAKNGPDAGKTCVVERDVVTVGKMADCDLVLSDSTVSRRHLRIARTRDPQSGETRWIL